MIVTYRNLISLNFCHVLSGFLQKGTYQQNGVEAEFMNAGFAKGIIIWQVIVVYQKDDDVGRIAAKRVINSIEIHQD